MSLFFTMLSSVYGGSLWCFGLGGMLQGVVGSVFSFVMVLPG